MAKCEYRTNEINKKSCDSLIDGGFCKIPELFRCNLWIEKHEPRLSHSSLTNFLRCPKLYYYSNIKGLQLKEQFQSDPLKIGSMVDKYITSTLLTGEPKIYLNDDITTTWQAKSIGIIKAFNKLINIDKVKERYTGQKEFDIKTDGMPHIKGFIDLESKSGKHFIELKVGRQPSYYTNLFYSRPQLTVYFMSNPSYEYCRLWAIRVPDIKRTGKFKNETLNDYSERCTRVMIAEPRHYFPGYNDKTKNFGVKFGRGEMDIESTIKQYRLIADMIKLCIKKDVWVRNGNGCLHPFQCDFLDICENNGAISTDCFDIRKKPETRKVKLQS